MSKVKSNNLLYRAKLDGSLVSFRPTRFASMLNCVTGQMSYVEIPVNQIEHCKVYSGIIFLTIALTVEHFNYSIHRRKRTLKVILINCKTSSRFIYHLNNEIKRLKALDTNYGGSVNFKISKVRHL